MAKIIRPYQYPNFIEFCKELIAESKKGNYFDFEFKKNSLAVSQRTSKMSAWPIAEIELNKTKPVTSLKSILKDGANVYHLRQFLNFIQLAQPDVEKDLNIIGCHKSGFIHLTTPKDIDTTTTKPVTPPVTVPKLAFKTDLKATAAIGDKLSVEWSGGVAPYQVEVQADTVAIVDFVDVGSVVKYDYDTTGKKAGTYQISVKDSAGSVISSVQSVVS